MDELQKRHTKQVGWMPRQQLEGKIGAGNVLIAETTEDLGLRIESEASGVTEPLVLRPQSLGYLIAQDRYFKRDDVGIIYQINVAPEYRRTLVAATLLKAQFERSAYGCKLYCCWCAQDIEANRFWEAMGFVPLAFRAGSEKRAKGGRVHIFWQKRIRQGDMTTPWWFPCQTNAGAIREDRIVLPIPPGKHWSDEMPRILPETEGARQLSGPKQCKIPAQAARQRGRPMIASGGLRYNSPHLPVQDEQPKRAPKPKAKNDPKLVAAARELRDRWLEQMNQMPMLPNAKYDVSRCIASTAIVEESRFLPAA